MTLTASLLDPHTEDGLRRIEQLTRLAGSRHADRLLPEHFLPTAFMKIGARVMEWRQEERTVAIAFLMSDPECADPEGVQAAWLPLAEGIGASELMPGLRALLGGEQVSALDISRPLDWPSPPPSHVIDGVEYGPPSTRDVEGIRTLQSEVWQSGPEENYPGFLHSPDSRATWSLAARHDGEVIGFLFGFHCRGPAAAPARTLPGDRQGRFFESQVMAVDGRFRGRGIAFHLKRLQAESLAAQGVTHVLWTADPLQFPNANLNCNRLGAMGMQLFPDYLPFRNQLNQISASRLRMVWPLTLRSVEAGLRKGRVHGGAAAMDVSGMPHAHTDLGDVRLPDDCPQVAVEVPGNWTELQSRDLERALAWRTVTDEILTHYLNAPASDWAVTRAARQGDRRYLIVSRWTEDRARN